MALGLPRRFRRLSRLFGLLVAAMALVGQLAFGAVLPPDGIAQAQLAALEAASVPCHGTDADHGGPAPHPRDADHALCPLGCGLALPSVALPFAPHLPLPPLLLRLRARPTDPARAPPTPTVAAAYPRGPPDLA